MALILAAPTGSNLSPHVSRMSSTALRGTVIVRLMGRNGRQHSPQGLRRSRPCLSLLLHLSRALKEDMTGFPFFPILLFSLRASSWRIVVIALPIASVVSLARFKSRSICFRLYSSGIHTSLLFRDFLLSDPAKDALYCWGLEAVVVGLLCEVEVSACKEADGEGFCWWR